MFDKVLIANRGAIACRIIRTLKTLGVKSVAVYSKADAQSLHVSQADEAICIGEALASESYLDVGKVLDAAEQSGAQAIHPGYGFLSENASFAEECARRGIAFIGPTPQQLRDFGLKHTARDLAEASGVPLLPGTGLLTDVPHALGEAARIGYPVMLKSTAGGGGIGMQLCHDEQQLTDAFATVQRLGQNNFSNAGIFLEKYVAAARHIEVQIFGDGKGKAVALGERDCSLQRRNQKVVEETPAPNLSDDVRHALWETAKRLGESVNYCSAGTVEYIYDPVSAQFYFLEVNTRLQVEHGVTEQVTGVDLVQWMVQVAAGESPNLDAGDPPTQGHSIQVRLYAEDPAKDFQPSAGLLTQIRFPQGVRCDSWLEPGVEVPPFYDPMLAKIIVHAADRDAALVAMDRALADTAVAGIETNLDYLRQVVADSVFRDGTQTTRYLNEFSYRPHSIEVLTAGTQTTVQDYPGRQGYWDIGVPPSGPMDDLAFRLGNCLLGNDDKAAGLEITVTGPALRFNSDTRICLTGAPLEAELDGASVPWYQPMDIAAGSVLKLGKLTAAGARAYLAVQGGIDVPDYLGSKSTFTLGQFGGHGGRPLRVGDVLHVSPLPTTALPAAALDAALVPEHDVHWTMHVIYGPHGAPDFFTDQDIATFFASDWEVHYNSSRTGVRLIGPKPEWARTDGGEAGLHPSNLHDNAYAIGTVDFTGDMPVILGPDGPSLGGFVCPATIVAADRWKLGQLRPGDKVSFVPVDQATANAMEQAQDVLLAELKPQSVTITEVPLHDPVVRRLNESQNPVAVSYRPSGDKYLLVEYGPMELDINLRFRVHALMLRLQELAIDGLRELTPGIRSLQVHYDSRVIKLDALLDRLVAVEGELKDIDKLEVPARIVHLPLSWDDPSTKLAIEKYMQSVRKDAPWCPSNIEFIRRINGLDDIEQVKDIVFGASYLVMGLGDVYLGAPVATPMDPRHRLVTTKYNPARTWTPENAVGIGGSYMCVYGMEGPGGYQFVGRTVQMWNRYRQTADFEKPWLLRFFDQIRFYPVSEDELKQMREDFPRGKFQLKVEQTTFSLADYNQSLADNAAGIQTFKATQQAAFDAERERWIASGQVNYQHDEGEAIDEQGGELALTDSESLVESHVHGSVWQVEVTAGQQVKVGDVLVVLESMKMEIAVHAEHAGTVARLLCQPGAQVAPGQPLLVIDSE